MTKRKPPSDPPAEIPRDEADIKPDAFDVWLNRGLHQLYGDIAKEPIPDELLRLIEDDRPK